MLSLYILFILLIQSNFLSFQFFSLLVHMIIRTMELKMATTLAMNTPTKLEPLPGTWMPEAFRRDGVDGFYWQQVSGDSGSGAKCDFKGRTMGIGPVISYVLPVNKTDTWVFEAKWLPESNVEKRIKGDYLWVKVIYQFE